MPNEYDNEEFFAQYAQMDRSKGGLEAAGEWHQLRPLFPPLEGMAVLDLGCGSGILSIAAVNLGAERALGVDIDPKSVDVAYENAALNGIGRDRYTVRAGNVLSDKGLAAELARNQYHLVLANIVADVIIPLAPQVPGLLEQDGVFLCSGIIDTRTQEVEAALKQAGLTLIGKREKNGWAALEARRANQA